jgi:hypothetical protein
MPFFDDYNEFRVSIAFYKNKQFVRRATPLVADMRTAYSIADKMLKRLDADDYSVVRFPSESEAKKIFNV